MAALYNYVLGLCGRVLRILGLSFRSKIKLNFPFGSVKLNEDNIIGEGAFSLVLLATNQNNSSIKYAIKKVLIQSDEINNMINNEIEALERFKHRNIIPLLGVLKYNKNDRNITYLAFPYIEKGSLRGSLYIMMKNNKFKQELNKILSDFTEILNAVNVLHSYEPSYVHQDIKPENILIDSNGRPLLTDFGSVRLADIHIKSRKESLKVSEEAAQFCTMAYRAPELFDPPNETKLDCRTDVWSLGCLLFAWWFGYSPFESEFNESGMIKVTECTYSRVLSKIPKKINPTNDDNTIHQLTEWILQKDISTRPYVTDIITHIDDIIQNSQRNIV